jgi:hypothetical protein
MLGMALALWVLNAWFTIDALSILGLNWVIGGVVAVGLTLIEQYLWKQRPDVLVIVIVALVSVVDIATSLIGIVPSLAQRLPAFAHGIDQNPLLWIGSSGVRPFQTVCLGLAAFIAIAPEPLVRYFWRRFQQVWQNRY